MTATLSDPPIRTSLLLALTTQGALLNELFTALPSASSDVPALHASLVQSSAQLDALARDAEAHQRAWDKLLAQKREVEALERKLRALIRELEGGRIELEGMVDEGRRVSEGIEKSESGMCSYAKSGQAADSQIRLACRSYWHMRTRWRAQRPRRCPPFSHRLIVLKQRLGQTRHRCARVSCGNSEAV